MGLAQTSQETADIFAKELRRREAPQASAGAQTTVGLVAQGNPYMRQVRQVTKRQHLEHIENITGFLEALRCAAQDEQRGVCFETASGMHIHFDARKLAEMVEDCQKKEWASMTIWVDAEERTVDFLEGELLQ